MVSVEQQVIQLPLNKLEISKFNVRKEVGDISELIDSIKQHGILEPLLVREDGKGYEIIAGSRRFVAAKKAGLKQVPTIVKDLKDAEVVILSLAENLHRNNLQPEEIGQAIQLLRGFGLTQEQVGKRINISQMRVSDYETIYQLLIKLHSHGMKVEHNPSKEREASGNAIALDHVVLIERTFNNPDVRRTLKGYSEKAIDKMKIEMAKQIASLPRHEANEVLNRFKLYPDKPIDEALSFVESSRTGVDTTDIMPSRIRPSTARLIEEVAQERKVPKSVIMQEVIETGVKAIKLQESTTKSKAESEEDEPNDNVQQWKDVMYDVLDLLEPDIGKPMIPQQIAFALDKSLPKKEARELLEVMHKVSGGVDEVHRILRRRLQ